MSKRNLTGKQFGRLTAIEKVGSTSGGNALWKCRCSCPKHGEVIVRADCLRSGKTTSCGCLIRELNTLNLTKYKDDDSKRLAGIFAGMKTRCYNEKSHSYPDYGARGIRVCDEWLNSIDKFIRWSKSHGYRRGLSIDRIDNDKGYSPDNCRWTTCIVQNNNTRANRVFTLMRMKKSIADWARYLNVDPRTLWYEPDHIVYSKLKQLLSEKLKKLARSGVNVLSLMGVNQNKDGSIHDC